ncbi:hypothetical protein MTR_7g082560 [Medicago truncatula]|uniref:RNase H type-1 domain-containing protein n=1 Tax=Medicago truncatula TaxID=3880 RepID=G7KV65_MEDTR|nr:hypothetical protein MTR_7g082560 [Medicago truncatula]
MCQCTFTLYIGICSRDSNGAFVLAWTDCFSPTIDVDIGEALGTQSGVSEFSVLISKCIHLLGTDPMNSYVKFIRRQANGVAHSLSKAALSEANFRIHYNISSCIET